LRLMSAGPITHRLLASLANSSARAERAGRWPSSIWRSSKS
jgi:hypothetical protein